MHSLWPYIWICRRPHTRDGVHQAAKEQQIRSLPSCSRRSLSRHPGPCYSRSNSLWEEEPIQLPNTWMPAIQVAPTLARTRLECLRWEATAIWDVRHEAYVYNDDIQGCWVPVNISQHAEKPHARFGIQDVQSPEVPSGARGCPPLWLLGVGASDPPRPAVMAPF